MKTNIFSRSWRSVGRASSGVWTPGATLGALMLLLATPNLDAGVRNGVVVGTQCGGGYTPYYGYVEGNPITSTDAKFHTPLGLAIEGSGQYLFVADKDNNAIRVVDLLSAASISNLTYTFAPIPGFTSGTISNPVGVALDTSDNVYVLNRGNGKNGSVAVFDFFYGSLITNLATGFTNANAITLDPAANVYVTASNNVFKITPDGVKSTIATVGLAGASLQGLVVMDNGQIAVCDSGRHGIYLINPTNGVVTTNTGFNGVGDNNNIWTNTPNYPVAKSLARFNQPMGLAKAGQSVLIVADTGNNRVKVVDSLGSVTNLYGVTSNLWNQAPGTWPGWWDGPVTVPDALGDVEARLPNGVLFAPGGAVYVTEGYYHLVRKVTGANLPPVPPPPPPPPAAPTILLWRTNYNQVFLAWSASPGATSYNVKRSPSSGTNHTIIATVSATNYTDTDVFNGVTYYYVVSALGAGGEGPDSSEISATPPLPPVPDPQIGYVDFPATSTPVAYTSVFHPVPSYVAYNDTTIIIKGTPGSSTYYTYDYTLDATAVSKPATNSASVPSDYQNGLFPNQVFPYTIAQIAPYLTIKAMGAKADGSPDSAVVKATFQFVTGNPNINGNNAAQFTISDITANARLYYTLDGSDPSNTNGVDLGIVPTPTNVWTVGFPVWTNTLFKVRAFRDNYQPSAIVSNWFSPTNIVANTISFGFAAGEASSDFIAAPGQNFYAPVSLAPLAGAKIYSLQFNLTVTNAGPNPGPAVPGVYNFQSFLEKPIPGTTPPIFERIPPLMFSAYALNPPPPSQISIFDGLPFVNLLFVNTNLNLLGVGWLERAGATNLYNTTLQTLIDYSQAHDTLFTPSMGQVVLGGYAFRVPTNAVAGQTYQIQIGRPSATSDGIGRPGYDVYIATPTNGSMFGGAPINSVKWVTVGQRKYVVGDCAPFRWFNAGDFGNTNLNNSDVEQVFQSAIYYLNSPPDGSDFFDSMDSCGGLGVTNAGTGYLTYGGALSLAQQNALFDGNDTTINQVPFGDGTLDVCDVYVTFRRSLDPSLTWFRRFWTNGVLAAEPTANAPGAKDLGGFSGAKLSTAFLTNPPAVNFSSGDVTGSPGQTVYIPITAKIFGDYPLRVLMLNLSVDPLDGSPPLTTAVQFTPNAALGTPTLSSSIGSGNFAGTWLNSTIAGLAGTATVGTLAVTIPASASSSSAYAIHFDHASASPNGIASFPKQTLTGLILLADRSSSIFNDGIPDSWRLRYFGSVNNMLSQAAADADGDGVSNWQEYIAGTDPSDAQSRLHVSTDQALSQKPQDCVVHWPSVAGKHYLIERSTSLFNPIWIPVSTNTGTGSDMEIHDATGGAARFYRVHVTQ